MLIGLGVVCVCVGERQSVEEGCVREGGERKRKRNKRWLYSPGAARSATSFDAQESPSYVGNAYGRVGSDVNEPPS